MNRTTRTVVVMAVATLMAGIASLGVYAAVKSIPVREVEVAHTFVAVAARNLPTGSRITEKDVKLVAWPARNPISGAFSELKPILDRGLVAAVGENEPVTETKLAPIGSGAGLPPSIPPGMRAMSVKVDEVIGVAGFVVPGTRVDLVVTLRGTGQRRRIDVAHRCQQRARPDGRHEVRPGAGEGWQAAAFDRRHSRGLAERRRARSRWPRRREKFRWRCAIRWM